MARKISFDPIESSPTETAPRAPMANSRPLMGLERSIKQASALGAISRSLGGINEKSKRADEIEQQLIKGQVIVELDPGSIDASFVRDRMEASEAQRSEFRELIRNHGQAVPILVRPHPQHDDRYEVAFGHRRLQAVKELGIKVKAVVRDLSDEQLVIAQGQENSGRTDLTYIERARFAANLEERNFSRETIMASLNVDKAALSRLISFSKEIPGSLVDQIGPAPAFGRVRWSELAELIGDNLKKAKLIAGSADFAAMDSDQRFEFLHKSLSPKRPQSEQEVWSAKDGTKVARLSRGSTKISMTFDNRVAPDFGDFVKSRLQDLFDEYRARKRA
ncbi:plasmid partitioning protein RepB [Roseiarcaceae bacterium H3SJ34-1]|uniref:plasmid partitioning protein RepB n=1 Tax=Terripilifer ovatus TaxID=3032367 RepID=UPI003AB97373|nr:plasmid partitioning protein RepB [Roseiarcaceae bacterium H3SJ34-1]